MQKRKSTKIFDKTTKATFLHGKDLCQKLHAETDHQRCGIPSSHLGRVAPHTVKEV